MKFISKNRKQGSVLVVTMVTCGVVATVLASYLVLLSTRYNLTARSMAWNAAMPVSESGLEEALTHLQYDTNSPGANGWDPGTYGGQPVNTKTRHFADGSYAFISIANAASANPTIYSSGFVPAPFGHGYISRTVRVTTTRPKAFVAAIAANGQVSMTGKGGIVDSYNSCLGAYSTTNSLGTNGSIATNYKAASAIRTTGHIYGTVTTGAGGTTTTSGNGSIGDKDWNATHIGVEPGWSDDDMNVAFPTNGPPPGFETYLPIPLFTIEGTNSITYLPTGNYSGTSFTSDDSTKPMIVTGNAILYLSGNLRVSGVETGTRHPGYIEIRPGASLTLYVGGSDPFIGGDGVINRTLQPANFTYYGLNTNTKLTISGSGTFIGTINAPQAAPLAISGNGGIFGAAIVGTYANSGNASFHYDECLGAGSFLTITSWREL